MEKKWNRAQGKSLRDQTGEVGLGELVNKNNKN